MKITGLSKTRMSKFQAKIGVFAGIGMLLIFLFTFVLKWEALGIILFCVVWVGIVATFIYQSYTNAFSDEGIHHQETSHAIDLDSAGTMKTSYAQKLRDLEQLKNDGLITEPEYNTKRKEIMDEDWGR